MAAIGQGKIRQPFPGERNPKERITTLIFIAPKAGIQKLGMAFPKDVQSISARLGLALKLRELP